MSLFEALYALTNLLVVAPDNLKQVFSGEQLVSDCADIRSALTLSLPRVINFKFPLQPHQKYYITCSMKNFAFHRLLKWKWLYYQFSLRHLYMYLEKVGRTYFLNLDVKGLSLRISCKNVSAQSPLRKRVQVAFDGSLEWWSFLIESLEFISQPRSQALSSRAWERGCSLACCSCRPCWTSRCSSSLYSSARTTRLPNWQDISFSATASMILRKEFGYRFNYAL